MSQARADETHEVAMLRTGSGSNQRWYLARRSLAGLLADGPFRSVAEAEAALPSQRVVIVGSSLGRSRNCSTMPVAHDVSDSPR